jgi:hypothetical protein
VECVEAMRREGNPYCRTLWEQVCLSSFVSSVILRAELEGFQTLKHQAKIKTKSIQKSIQISIRKAIQKSVRKLILKAIQKR